MEHDPVEIAVHEVWQSVNRLSDVMPDHPASADDHAQILLEAQKGLFRIIHRLEQKRAA